jgi:beta-lactamase regulating signal transducer with metallopeptidase domain
MIRMKSELLTACDQFVAAAANGVYQGIIIAALVALSLRLNRRVNAATRHAVWFCTLLLLIFLVGAHCLIAFRPLTLRGAQTNPVATLAKSESSAPPTAAAIAVIDTSPESVSSNIRAFDDLPTHKSGHDLEYKRTPPLLHSSEVSPSELNDEYAKNQSSQSQLNESPGQAAAEFLGVDEGNRFSWFVARLANPVSVNLAVGSGIPRIASLILLCLLVAISVLKVGLLLFQLSQLRKLKQNSLAPSEPLSRLFQNLVALLPVRRNVELRVSAASSSSFLLGFLHPVILMPLDERMELAEAGHVLRHELAHVQRRDDWTNLIQQFALALFPFGGFPSDYPWSGKLRATTASCSKSSGHGPTRSCWPIWPSACNSVPCYSLLELPTTKLNYNKE